MTRVRTLFSRFKALVQRKDGRAWSGAEELARREVDQKNEQLRKLQEQAGKKDRELADLHTKAASARSVSRELPVFFVVGRAKSGTSWLRSIMDSHPDVLCVNEGRFFGRDYRGHGTIPRSLYGALADSEYLKTWVERSPWSRGEDAEEHLRNLTRHVIDYFMAEKLAKTGKKFAGDKTPLIGMEVSIPIPGSYTS